MFQTSALQKVVLFLLLAFLIVSAIYYAKPFLVPLCFGGLLSMLFLPLSRWFENQKIPKVFSILICIIIFLVLITGIIWLISWQVTDLATESTGIENKVRKMISDIEKYIRTHFGISKKQQEEIITEQAQENGSLLSNLGSSVTGFVVDFILALVYI